MVRAILIGAALFCAAGAGRPAQTQEAGGREPARVSSVPRLYTATGPATSARLAELRAAIGRLAGVSKVEARPEFGAVTVTIDGDGASTESLLVAAARSAGYVMRPVRPRYFAAAGPNAADALRRLQAALQGVAGVEEVALSGRPEGAAVRVTAVSPHSLLAAAGRRAGFELQAVDSFVAAGPQTAADLARLKSALGRVSGVDRVEVQGLAGGATLLVYGPAGDFELAGAARKAGYDLWHLKAARSPLEYRVVSGNAQKLSEALGRLEGVGQVELRTAPDGPRLSITGGRVRGEAILAAASEASCTLAAVEPPVTLPTLTPQAGRSTPPDYAPRFVEERAILGEPAPPFTVLGIDGKQKRRLTDYLAAGKPVVLIFGSCTCPRFLNACPPLEALYREYRDRVTFLLVYVAEAHPGQILAVPTANGGSELRVIPLLGDEKQNLEHLKHLVTIGKLTIPAAVETPANSANREYAAYPNRLYVIGADGRVAFKGAPGPTGLKVPDLADWLRSNVP